MIHTVLVYAYHGRDFHQITKLRNFTKQENRDLIEFRFPFHLMLEEALSNLIVCLMISQNNYIPKLYNCLMLEEALSNLINCLMISQNNYIQKLNN